MLRKRWLHPWGLGFGIHAEDTAENTYRRWPFEFHPAFKDWISRILRRSLGSRTAQNQQNRLATRRRQPSPPMDGFTGVFCSLCGS